MPEQTDPFKRLHDNLSVVIDYARDNGFPTDMPAREAWIQAYSVDGLGFLQKLHELMFIVDSCEQVIGQEQAINQDLYLKQITEVKRALSLLSMNSGSWRAFLTILNDSLMVSLLLMSESISFYGGEEVIPEEELASLQSDIEDLVNKVVDSDIDADIKSVLLEGLEAVRQAILNYRVSGAEGIRNAVDRNIGSYARHKEEFDRASENEGKEVIYDYKRFINEVNATISTVLKFRQLTEPAAQVLPMLGMG